MTLASDEYYDVDSYLFLRQISYMFRLKYIAINKQIRKAKGKNLQLRGFEISNLRT
jgi:hypothetical protein